MNAPESILDYLKTQIPAYPFDPKLDEAFVHELIKDFHDLDLLEETKTFRWYYNNRPTDRFKNVRVGLRRWIANSWAREQTKSLLKIGEDRPTGQTVPDSTATG